jgi:hypothetical protein
VSSARSNVAIDAAGGNLHEEVTRAARARLAGLLAN